MAVVNVYKKKGLLGKYSIGLFKSKKTSVPAARRSVKYGFVPVLSLEKDKFGKGEISSLFKGVKDSNVHGYSNSEVRSLFARRVKYNKKFRG